MSPKRPASLVPVPPPGPQAELIAPEPLEVLREVARRFNGSAHRTLIFIGPPCLSGHHEGRDLGLMWKREQAHVGLRAPNGVDLHIEQAPAWRRWLFGETLRTGGESRHLIDPALDLCRRFGITRLVVRNNNLSARAAPGLSAARIRGLILGLHDLVWLDAARTEAARARPVDPELGRGPTVDATFTGKPSVAGTRCPFCHDDLAADAPVAHCATCDAPHHPSCFEEGGGCSIAGCQQSRARGRKGT